MKSRFLVVLITCLSILFLTSGGLAAPGASPLSNAFTYQGRLERAGAPYSGTCDFLFSLYDTQTSGTMIGDTNATILTVVDGLFTTRLDFGSGAFNGEARWLELNVQCPGDIDPTTFPRQELTAAPYALYALGAPWSGLTGKPAGLDDGDNDTTYSAGDGLLLDTTSFSIDPMFTQRTVWDSCTEGGTIRAIHEDGSVECQLDDPFNRSLRPESTYISTLDPGGPVGQFTSATISTDGLGLISYYDAANGNLNVAHCDDPYCGFATIVTLDSSGDVGRYTSITIDSYGLGLISYYDATYGDLKLARCADSQCSSAYTIKTLDTSGDVGLFTSLTINNKGYPLISYYDSTNGNLKALSCTAAACDDFVITVLDSANNVGGYTSITRVWGGIPMISYYDFTNGDLKVALCMNNDCQSADIATVDSVNDVGTYNSITTGVDGLGLISYYDATDGNLKVAHCNNYLCSSATVTDFDISVDLGRHTSITIGADGLGLISFYDATSGSLVVAHCANLECSSIYEVWPDSNGIVGEDTAVTIGVNGLPLIAYFDRTNGALKSARCSNIYCMDYYHRR